MAFMVVLSIGWKNYYTNIYIYIYLKIEIKIEYLHRIAKYLFWDIK